jgi:DNA-binding CsgD family transcriptional regulator
VAPPEPPPNAPGDPGPDFLARTLDRQELERLRDAVGRAEQLLGRPSSSVAGAGPEAIGPLLAELEAELAAAGLDDGPERAAHEDQMRRLRARFEQRRAAFGRVEAEVRRLREMTSPPTILKGAPRALCQGSELERVLLSEVRDGAMVALAAHFETDPERAEKVVATLAEHPIRLEHPLLEAEVLRRRRATGVSDAQLHPRADQLLNETMKWSSYVVAPLVVRGGVIAVIHADRGSRGLDVLDREVLWRFAVGAAQAYESAALRRGLRHEREQMRRFLDRLDTRLGELSDAGVEIAPWDSVAEAEPPPPPPTEVGSAFDRILTRRELEVVALMAEGLSNRTIADRLVITEGTVKFHVNSILKKLRAANRAEAVSRYLSRGGGGRS